VRLGPVAPKAASRSGGATSWAERRGRGQPARASRAQRASAPNARHPGEANGLLKPALPSGARLRFPAGTDLRFLRALPAAL
jgi:hypothetical protein